MVWLDVLILLASLVVLAKSGGWVVEHSVRLSRLFGISTFAIGFILISISTSLPELGVAIFSTFQGVPGLSVGDVLGANLTDLTLILGLCAIFGGTIYLKKKELMDLIELLFITSLVTVMIFQNAQLSPLMGWVLLALFAFLLIRLYKKGKIPQEVFDGIKEKRTGAFLRLIGSLILLLSASYFLVLSASSIAFSLNLAPTFIGATVVALGTTLPELTVELRAVRSKQYALALGDLFGSAVTNLTLVLGTLSVINTGRPKIELGPLVGILPIFFVTLFFIWYTLSKKGKISKAEGFILIGFYVLFLIQELELLALLG